MMLNQRFNPHIRASQGVILSIGAPLGWLLIRMFQGATMIDELSVNMGLYSYMLLGTSFTFSLFGWYVGRKENLITILALHDELTGLYNIRYFRQRLEQEILTAQRESTPLVLISFDIDHFKKINDHYGHLVGDEVLKTIGLAANNVLRKYELLARVGGEEFAVLLPRCQLEAGTRTAERIRTEIAAAFVQAKKGEKITVTVSLGVTTLKTGDKDKSFLARADANLYQAKNEGRDRVVVG